jgi:hypothetical protein
MSDLEERLADALARGAEDAPAAIGLAEAARARARTRRRARIGAVAAAVALCIAVPTAVVAARGTDDGRPSPAHVANDGAPDWGVPDGMRVESWRGVTALVPDSWGWGGLQSWCANDGKLEARVERPGGVEPAIGCPTSTYGLSFQQLPPAQDRDPVFDWPVVLQTGQGWPPHAYVGAHGVGDVLVQVTAPTEQEALAVLATVRRIGPDGDPYGCTSSRGEAPPLAVPAGAMRICRYDGKGLLEQSEMLSGNDVERAVDALEAAPEIPPDQTCPRNVTEVVPVVRMRTSQLHANVDLGGDCPIVHGLDADRELTPDVLYWALSPGWSGSVPEGVSLPSELRQR